MRRRDEGAELVVLGPDRRGKHVSGAPRGLQVLEGEPVGLAYHRGGVVDDTTGPHLSKVYTPIKSFLTREGVDWRTIIVAPE